MAMIIQRIIPSVDYNKCLKRLDTHSLIKQSIKIKFKSSKLLSQLRRKRHNNLRTSVINSPMSPPSLIISRHNRIFFSTKMTKTTTESQTYKISLKNFSSFSLHIHSYLTFHVRLFARFFPHAIMSSQEQKIVQVILLYVQLAATPLEASRGTLNVWCFKKKIIYLAMLRWSLY